ncbi:hypothetical protein EWM64_g6992 [Hericium alpestre]|uniref:Aminoglycoside phosphotransferase domain-containing protein n=1 Tax=Hericium alpestre TaxID=135208 RepID=A0A4Y9ZU28_9AGAM|nr:hypothetical protein EWM64_g6992 [Hericium alpestre]
MDVDAVLNPSQDAIDDVVERMKRAPRLRINGKTVWAKCLLQDLGDGRIVKSGPRVSVDEVKAMLFIRAYTTIPVPEPSMFFVHEDMAHIVMELVEGVPIGEAFQAGLISEEETRTIAREWRAIAGVIQELGRRHPHFEFGSWPEGPYNNTYFYGALPTEPFRSVDAFHAYWNGLLAKSSYLAGDTAHQQLQALREESEPHAPVLAHGDLSPRNILVKDGKLVAVVDWETFGWYPDFWEEMGMWNEVMRRDLKAIIQDVCGQESEAASVYIGVLSAIDSLNWCT